MEAPYNAAQDKETKQLGAEPRRYRENARTRCLGVF